VVGESRIGIFLEFHSQVIDLILEKAIQAFKTLWRPRRRARELLRRKSVLESFHPAGQTGLTVAVPDPRIRDLTWWRATPPVVQPQAGPGDRRFQAICAARKIPHIEKNQTMQRSIKTPKFRP